MIVYADNAATTAVSEAALAAMLPCLGEIYGNPSSLHTPGQRAAELLEEARGVFARHLGARPREIYFTSGGSESDNQALRSAAALGARKGKRHIVSTVCRSCTPKASQWRTSALAFCGWKVFSVSMVM